MGFLPGREDAVGVRRTLREEWGLRILIREFAGGSVGQGGWSALGCTIGIQ